MTHDLFSTSSRNDRRPSPFACACLLSAGLLAGCSGKSSAPVPDAQLTAQVQSALKGDAAINQQPIQVATNQGIVTLTGNVSDDTASTVAAQDAAKIKGVKEVVDQLTVADVQVAPTITSPSAPSQPRPTTVQERQALAQNQPLPPPPATESASSPPPAPTFRDITAPAGTIIPIRITEALSSQNSQDGQPFSGTVTHEVIRDGMVVIPAGSAVSGRVLVAKDAAHFKGHSELSIELTSVRRHGVSVPLATDAYTLEGKNRGTNTAEKIGGGAAIGAVLGGIFGGGKGAGIGALAGGGGGTVLQGATRGQQVSIGSESIIHFHLARPLTVRTSESPSNYEPTTLRQRQP